MSISHSPEPIVKNLYISTYGCQMNVYDSDRMADLMAPHGYTLVDAADDADLVIINTCHIREKASEKLFSELGRMRDRKEDRLRQGKTTLIAVTGCVAQAEGDEIKRRAPCVDIVLGPQAYHRLPELVATVERKTGNTRKQAEVDIQFPVVSKFDFLPETARRQGVSAFLTVQEGCDKFCTFCVVPYTRGSEYSRSVEDIRKEAKHLLSLGAKELVLLGQNVNAYHGLSLHGKEVGLGSLIQELAGLEGVKRIRYMTSHPRDMDEDLFVAHAQVDKLMPFLHLPVQAGSNKILEAMNRKHTREEYLRVIERLLEARPDLVFSSDFIVGFPGETERDFEDTLDLVRRVGFVQTYSFKYSPRPGTPGALMDQVPEDVKQERLFELQSMLKHQQEEHFKTYVGKTLDVLIESVGREPGTLVGRTPYAQLTHLLGGPDCIGREYKVLIEKALSNSLAGRVVEEHKRAA